jgi:uncharacterized protein
MIVNNITGPPVEGNNFFGREKELDYVWKHIQKGNSIILSAPRRVGKSSFAKKIIKSAEKMGWQTLEINLEEIKTEIGFVKIFTEELQGKNWWTQVKTNSAKLGAILDGIKLTGEYEGMKATIEYKQAKEDIYEKLKKLINHKENTLIMVDELTVLLNSFIEHDQIEGKLNAEFFLNWLRGFRQVTGTKIHWIFCSSIGIENFTSLHNMSYTMNDVDSFPIDAFTKEQAINLINALAKSENVNIKDEQIIYMLQKLGWYLPYFIQILFSNLNQLVKIHDKKISNETIDEAYQMLINEKHLNTWDERLKEYAEIESYARLVLKHLSKVKIGDSRENLFNILYSKLNDDDKAETIISKVLYMLKNDGYLIDTNDSKYAFRSPLLRDFWFNRFVK